MPSLGTLTGRAGSKCGTQLSDLDDAAAPISGLQTHTLFLDLEIKLDARAQRMKYCSPPNASSPSFRNKSIASNFLQVKRCGTPLGRAKARPQLFKHKVASFDLMRLNSL